jgi:hypothetical protein
VVVKPKTAAQIRAEKLKKALAACAKEKNKRKRAVCQAKARKLYGPKVKKVAKGKSSKKGKRSSEGSRGKR